MTTPSGEPYQYGDDTVAARLEVDIPSEAITSLGEVNKLTADLRANMEAVAKYSQDYSDYLRELPGALGEVDSAQSRMSASSASIFGGDMTPIADPFAGRDYGSGSSDMGGRAGAGRPMRGVDESTLIDLARNNPRQVANMAADRGLDDYFEDSSHILPRPEPGPRPGAGRSMQFSGGGRPPSSPTSPRASTGPGDDDGRAAGTTTGRQVTPEGTESQAERAAKRLLAELDKGSDERNLGQRARGFGESFQNSPLLNFLNTEGGIRGSSDALGFAGGIGRNIQQSAENVSASAEAKETQRQNLLSQAAEVAATNPELASQLTQRASSLTQSAGMARALPLLKGAGVVGAGVAGLAAVNAGIQKTGETLQDFRGTGVQMGGGIAEGAAFEAQIRTMAMNPFISTEQSRKIMQQALQSGYTGKEMDTMTEFMTDNLKQMNMEAAESMKLFQQNVLKGGGSVQGLEAQLSQNAAMAGTTNLTADQINDTFGRLSGQLIDRGVGAQPSGEIAQILSTLLEGNPVLKDSAPDTLAGLSSNASFNSYFAQRSGARDAGINSSNAQVWAGDNLSSQEFAQATVESLGDIIRPEMSAYNSGDENTRLSAIQRVATKMKVTPNQAQAYMEEFASGDLLRRPAEAQAEWEEKGGGLMTETGGGLFSRANPAMFGEVVSGIGHLGKRGWNAAFGNDESKENAKAGYDRWENEFALDMQLKGAAELYGGKAYAPDVLRQLAIDEYDGDFSKITIIEDGKEKQLSSEDITNEETMKKLQGGEIKVKTEGGGVQSLRDWGNVSSTDEAGTGGGTHVVHLSDEARRFFRLEGPNPAQQRANTGSGSHNSDDASFYGYGPQGVN